MWECMCEGRGEEKRREGSRNEEEEVGTERKRADCGGAGALSQRDTSEEQ